MLRSSIVLQHQAEIDRTTIKEWPRVARESACDPKATSAGPVQGDFSPFHSSCLRIPMKSPGHSEMMPPMDSEMMSPRARASLAAEVVPLLVADGQSFLAGFSRVRRKLSPVRSMRWAL